MSDQWTPEELRRLIALRPQVCEWEQCDNRTANERTWLMGGDPDDGDNYALIRECEDHARIPDERVDVHFVLRRGLIVREASDEAPSGGI